jgi:hypothetical protein
VMTCTELAEPLPRLLNSSVEREVLKKLVFVRCEIVKAAPSD